MDGLSKNFGTLTMPLLVLLAISFSALPAFGQYCSASGGGEQHISGVIVGNIVNTGTGSDGYADYTGMSTTIALGESQIATIVNGLSIAGSQCGIWIDWNADSDFDDAGETVAMSGGPASFTGTVTPPGTTTAGDKRMRVRIMGTGSITPCGNTTYGEVEDYTIAVISPWTGSGDENDPYQIWTVTDMQAIGASSGYWGSHFKLMASIDLGGFTGTSFNIIGIYPDYPFTGVFDGNGHTISNFTYTSTATDYIGVFGYVDGPGAEIKNLGLINVEVDAGTGDRVGSLVGRQSRGTITGCYVEGGSVLGDDNIGGLVGSGGTITDCYSEAVSVSGDVRVGGLAGSGGTITDCYSEAVSVSGDNYVGGLVGTGSIITNCSSNGIVSALGIYVGQVGGLAGNAGTVSNCYSTGSVTGILYVGGLVGRTGGYISNSYATGSVSGVDRVGGLVGYNRYGAIANCYSTGSVTGVAGVGGLVGYNNGLVSACFWDKQSSGRINMCGSVGAYGSGCNNTNGKTTAQMQDINTFLSGGWDFVNQADGPSDDWAEPEAQGYMICWWQLPENELPALPTFSGGTGEPGDPYLIATSSDLNRIGHNPRLMAASPHFELINDIDLAGVDFFFIGSRGHNYSGVFNGNGHTISNFTYSSTEISYVGLFGAIAGEDAEIKDLGLIDPDIDAGTGSSIGSLVGWLADGTVSGCYVEGGSVFGYENVGGLVGRNIRGTITNCYATGSVSAGRDVGGLLGRNEQQATVSNCHSSGIVLGNSGVGGLVGASGSGTITDCYSTATVSGGYSVVGGLVGYSGTITNCYATGDVSGNDRVGGLAGESKNITNCYATGNVSATNRTAGGLTGSAYGYLEGTVTNCYATGSVSAAEWGEVGGLMGENQGGTVTNCYATGNVQGDTLAGGLVGLNMNEGTVTNCYSTGSVTGTTEVGGLMGRNHSGTISASFWDVQTSGRSNMCGTEEANGSGCDPNNGKTTAQMQTMSTFSSAGWDFANVWNIDEGKSCPKFQWDYHPVGDFDLDKDVDLPDFGIFSAAWLSTPADLNSWNPVCDLYDPNETPPYPEYVLDPNDVIIDVLDLEIFSEHWLEGTAE